MARGKRGEAGVDGRMASVVCRRVVVAQRRGGPPPLRWRQNDSHIDPAAARTLLLAAHAHTPSHTNVHAHTHKHGRERKVPVKLFTRDDYDYGGDDACASLRVLKWLFRLIDIACKFTLPAHLHTHIIRTHCIHLRKSIGVGGRV